MSYYILAKRLQELARNNIRNMVPALVWDQNSSSFTLLDCFEQSLRASRRLLMEIDDQLVLLTATNTVLTQPINADTRFVAQFHDGPVKQALADVSALRALLSIASGTSRKGMLTLLDDEGKTLVRAELYELVPNEGAAVVVVSPRGLRGYDEALDELLASLRAYGGTPLNAGNLYRMIDHSSVSYVAKPAVEIGKTETAFDAATSLIESYLPVARANEDGIIRDFDTEFLHDYRVALRKIRSVLSLFKGVYETDQTLDLKQRFSALMAPTGPLRDSDVYLLDQQSFKSLVPATLHEGLDAMFEEIRRRRAQEQSRLAAHLTSQSYNKEIKALTKLFAKKRKLAPGPNASRGSYDLACELIWKRYRKICRIAASITENTPDDEIHQLRIECKKLRYLMEFFGPVFPKDPFDELVKPLKRLQDSLGLFNDCAVQQISLHSFVESLGDEPHKLDIAQSVGALITVLHQQQNAERERIAEAFARFNSERMQRSFHDLLRSGKEF